jgi:hypothetical protein
MLNVVHECMSHVHVHVHAHVHAHIVHAHAHGHVRVSHVVHVMCMSCAFKDLIEI